MELELGTARRHGEQVVVELLEAARPGRNRPSRVPTRETWVSTGTSGMPKENRSTQAAVLRPTPGSAVSSARACSTGRSRSRRRSGIRRRGDRARIGLDADRFLPVEPAGLDRVLDLGDGRVAHLPPRSEALAQPQVGDVAVAVVRRLGQDGEDQLVQRAPCGFATGGP